MHHGFKLANGLPLFPVQSLERLGFGLAFLGDHNGGIGDRGKYRRIAKVNNLLKLGLAGDELAELFAIGGAKPFV
ncbi:hypothetical protein PROH_12595 [Prochlorothrix hollandica PCC 9006 = CALU 1027]|uniref:Uncharacterized protein n=1 Tax=Prochlorothrix hollandica PCC 9006 = CALU 1027 TaxID=317619 RepID=A0A0M2PYI4_PROHO|nr:hypothetical protein PROH_12595 [Prochlorothrix hollandica PCC 9006 = CALU 1027]